MSPQIPTIVRNVIAKYKSKVTLDSGNTVYQYSSRQIALRNRRKAEQIVKLEKAISKLREQVRRDLTSDDLEKALVALVVGLIDETYERVGNQESADEGHFGVTGWQRNHVTFGQGPAKIRYVGKSGVKHEKTVSSAALLKALHKAYDAVDGKDTPIFEQAGVNAQKVNDYLAKFDVTAKDIRGFHANKEMLSALRTLRRENGSLPKNRDERKEALKKEFEKALENTAKIVGHEMATLRRQYLLPWLEEDFLAHGELPSDVQTLVKQHS